MDTGLAILIGAGGATVGWIFAQRQNRKLTRLEHTFNVLESYRNDEKHWGSFDRFVSMAKKNDIPGPRDSGRDDDIKAIGSLLFHYEYISAGIFSGGLDEGMIKLCEEGNIVELYKRTKDYIEAIRGILKKDGVYENFAGLGKRWAGPGPKVYVRLVEVFIMRPWRSRYL